MSVAGFLILASETEVSTEIPFFVIGAVFAVPRPPTISAHAAKATFPGGRGATAAICGVSVLLAAVAMVLIVVVTS